MAKKAERAPQMREQELLGIIETIPSILWSLSPAGETTHLSRRALDYYGVPLEELVGRNWLSFIHPDDREETAKTLIRAIEAGESYEVIHRIRRADGMYRWHQAKGEPLRDRQGRIIQWYGLTIDIDERKRAEEELRKSERELRALIDIMPAQIGTALPDGRCDFMGQSWLEYTGQTKEEVMGWGWADVIHPDDREQVAATWQAGLASREPVEQELRSRGANGTYRWFLNATYH